MSVPDEMNIQVAVDDDGAIRLDAVGASLPEAVRTATEYVQAKWVEAAMHGIRGLPPTGDYQYVIGVGSGLEYPYQTEFTGRVINYAPRAGLVEKGFGPFDMKPGLLRGPQARHAADGSLYNVVPFRWGTPRQSEDEAGTGSQRATLRSMPQEIYDIVQQFDPSRVVGMFYVPALDPFRHRKGQVPGEGETIMGAARRVYQYEWGEHLRREDIPEPYQAVAKPWHKSSLYEGMVRMEAGDQTRQAHHIYLTFRTVSERSSPESWQHPGVEGKPYSREVVKAEAENVKRLIRHAVQRAARGQP